MSYFQSLLRRIRPPRQLSRVMIDRLESRQMMSASPTVSNVYLTGSATACTGIVVQFDEPVDPAHAQDMQAYGAGKLPPTVQSSNFDWTQLLGFLAQPKPYLVTNGRLGFTSAVYDDAAATVTLVPVRAFNAVGLLRLLRVKGTGVHAMTDPNGNALNAGIDTYMSWVPHVGKQFSYLDADGDHVTLTLRGPGTIIAFLQSRSDRQPMIFIRGGNSRSILTGVVHQAVTGNGEATLAEVQGAGAIQNTLLTNPQFQILTLQP